MKNHQFIIFLTVVLAIYSSVNIYIYLKGYNAINSFQHNRLWYFIVFLLLALAFVAGRIIEARSSSVFSDILNIAGGFWMAFMLYGFIFLLLSDIVSLAARITGMLNQGNIAVYRKWAFIITVLASSSLIIAGFINALKPVTTKYELTINKPAGEIKELKIAAVSDIHLGSIIRKRSIRELSALLTRLKPDLVLLLGDIVDGEMGPVIRDDLLQYFSCPKCKDGLYAITGNHEFIGGAQRTIPYIESKGIRLLKDEVVTIEEGGIQLIGRLDRDGKRFYGKERKSLKELVSLADTTKPIILLDHQPFNLHESEKYGIDLQLSGHTHNGQMWPLNYITSGIYELSHGYKKKGNTHFIVSSGFGIWGPRVRLGSRPEIIFITLRFRND
ncbi:MAG TPA: metallophosphoesterase [Bacteroidales bacterium]|jgi:predicted MPP superfamily phosphohydrolase|nr:metallophosphoesterase [Bacteroidales bacterium]